MPRHSPYALVRLNFSCYCLRFANNFFYNEKASFVAFYSACAANCSFTTILTEKPFSDLSLNPVKIICSFLIRFSMNILFATSRLLWWLKLLESLSAFLLIRCINIRIASLRCFRLATSRLLWWLKLLESLSAFLLIRCINIRIASLRCFRLATSRLLWWAQVDSNHRPHAYQACALTC